MRKIIQISSAVSDASHDHLIAALCNDGTLWEFFQGEWHEVHPIPQSPTEEQKRAIDLAKANVDTASNFTQS